MTSPSASPPEPLSPGDQALVDLAASNRAIERSTGRRERAKTAAIVASMVANLALVIGVLLLIFSVNHRANDAVHSADATLAIARGFQCQTSSPPKGCPPPKPGAGSAAANAQSAIVDSIVYRVEVFVAGATHTPPPPRPADVPASIGP